MIKSFFQRLEATGVQYLLISGQATILYGAATFSEDVDIWLEPTAPNLERFVSVLTRSQATYYKLTPPFMVENLERGHGFHFVLPDDALGGEMYLDVMGKPPRVGTFRAADANARTFDTDFGRIRTVGIRELVELKKTQRPADYPIIGRLAMARLEEEEKLDETTLRWALDNVFGLAELGKLLRRWPSELSALAPTLPGPLGRAALGFERNGELPGELEDELESWFDARSAELRRADRHYWKSIIDELRELRRKGALVSEGTPV